MDDIQFVLEEYSYVIVDKTNHVERVNINRTCRGTSVPPITTTERTTSNLTQYTNI